MHTGLLPVCVTIALTLGEELEAALAHSLMARRGVTEAAEVVVSLTPLESKEKKIGRDDPCM